MGWFDGFPFKSKEQMQKEEREFENRIFPLGMKQRETVSAVLEKFLPKGKGVGDKEHLYAYISAKDKYTSQEETESAQKSAYAELKNQRWLKHEDKLMIIGFIELESQIDSIEQMPSIEAIKQQAKLLETQNFV